MDRVLVSVVMPVFNSVDTVLAAMESVLGQSVREIEFLICDDASTDGTSEAVLGVSDARIKYLRNAKNMGVGASRDRVIALASAPWVALIDADDVWLPNRLERLLAVIGGRMDCMVFDDIMTCHSVEGELVPWRSLHGKRAFSGKPGFGLEQYLKSPRLLIKPLLPLAAIQKINLKHSSRTFGEDAEFFIRLALSGVSFRYVSEAFYLYRVQPGSATAKADAAAMRECLEACAELKGWTESSRAVLLKKIDLLRAGEILYKAYSQIRQGSALSAIRLLISHPEALAILPGRALKHLAYQCHRLRHGGAARHSGEQD